MRTSRKNAVLGVTALLALHVIATFPYAWEGTDVLQSLTQPSVDWILLVALACIAVAGGFRRGLASLLTVAFLFAILYRFGSTLMPVFYGKPFEPYVDVLEVPGLVHLLLHRHSIFVQILLVAGALVAFVLVCWALRYAWKLLLRASTQTAFTVATLGLLQLLVVASWVHRDLEPQRVDALLRPSMYAQAVTHVVSLIRDRSYRVAAIVSERLHASSEELEPLPKKFEALSDVDVYVYFIESYGRGILGTKARADYAEWLAVHDAKLRAAGFGARSGWVRPSVRGGSSSLAHLEFTSGIRIENRRIFNDLLASPIRPLPALMRDAGHHTINVQPAMPRAWPEAAVFGYERDMFRSAFSYGGARYAWGEMPDQFALAHLLERVVRPSERPVFVQFVSVTGHAPFSLIPPYYADWSRCFEPAAFSEAPAQRFDITWRSYTGHPDLERAYLASMRYSLDVAVGFATQLERPSLLFVLGDHQPPLPYRDAPERMWDVPMHILSNRPALLERASAFRFTVGMTPDFDGRAFAAERFLYRCLDAYGR